MTASPEQGPFAVLRRFMRPRKPVERCELCSAPIAAEHQHLIEPATRRLFCACDPCALLFDQPAGGRYRRIPRRGRLLADFALGDEVTKYRRFQNAEPDPQPNADEYDAQCKWDSPAPGEKGIA